MYIDSGFFGNIPERRIRLHDFNEPVSKETKSRNLPLVSFIQRRSFLII